MSVIRVISLNVSADIMQKEKNILQPVLHGYYFGQLLKILEVSLWR